MTQRIVPFAALLAFAALSAFASLSGSAFAQHWQQLPGPTGGGVQNLHHAGNWLFAATEGGIFRRHDTDLVWRRSITGLGDHFVYALTGTNPLLAGTRSGTFISNDTGRSWQRPPEALDTLFVTALLTHSSGLVLAGTSEKVFKSSDGGLHWTPANLDKAWTQHFCETPDGSVLASFYYEGVHRTTNMCATWSKIFSVNGIINETAVDSSGVLYVGMWWRGVYRSTNNGSSWAQSNSGLHSGIHVNSLLSVSGNRIFAGMDSLIYQSINHGVTWTPVTSPGCGIMVMMRGKGGLLHAGTDGDGVYTSSDGGDMWLRDDSGLTASTVQQVMTHSSGTPFATTAAGGVYLSDDNGSHWQHQALGLPWFKLVRALAMDSAGRMYAATESGLYRSDNKGLTWMQKDLGIHSKQITTVHGLHGHMLVAINDSGLYRTTNGGELWTRTSTQINSLGNARSVGRHPGTGAVFVVATDHVFRSLDDGLTWTIQDSGLGGFYYGTVDFAKDGAVWIGSATTPFRSIDGGAFWTAAGDSGGPIGINALAIDRRAGIVYAGTDSGRVFWTADNGATWTPRHLPDVYGFVRTLALDSSGYVYAGPTGNGLFRIAAFVPAAVGIFTATVLDSDVRVRWRVLEERNVASYMVERLALHERFAPWRDAAFIRASGADEYEVTDRDLPPGSYRYRLRIVDTDGSEERVGQADAHIGIIPRIFAIREVAPHPVKGDASVLIDAPDAGEIVVTVHSLLGPRMSRFYFHATAAGTSRVSFGAADLPVGTYLIRAEWKNRIAARLLVVSR